MATFYIDPTGANGDGSLATPFNSWASVTWTAGNTYLQKAGTTFKGQIKPTADGTRNARIVIGSYPGDGNWPYAIVDGTGIDRPICIQNSRAYITIQDFEGFGGLGTAIISSESTTAASNIIIQRCYVHGAITTGSDSNGINLYCDDLLIKDCIVSYLPDDNIWINGARPIVENTISVGPGQKASANTGDCIQFNVITGNAIVRKCILRNERDKQCVVVSNAALPAYLIIEDCVMSGGAYCVNTNGTAAIVRRCRIRSETPSDPTTIVFQAGIYHVGSDAQPLTVKSCYIDCNNIAQSAIRVNANGSNTVVVTIENCTLRDNAFTNFTGLISISGTGTTVNIKNNILICKIVGGTFTTINGGASITFTLTNNIFHREYSGMVELGGTSYATIAALEAGGKGSNNRQGDALLDSSGQIPAASPAVGNGAHVGYGLDLNKNQFANPPSIGAFEYRATRGVR
jgi:hypothetical protein